MRYLVYLPVTAQICVEVESDSESEAKEAAFEVEFNLDVSGDGNTELIDWEIGVANEISVELCEDQE